MKIALLLSIIITALTLATTNAIRLHYNSSSTIHTLTNSFYPSHNIFISGGSTLQLLNGAAITGPSSVDDGESAVRIDDATFIAVNGTIVGGADFGGIGVTISSSRDDNAEASFGTGMAVYGGDAARNKTTQGGDAVQVIHAGSKATFDGGTIVAGKGCSQEVCGVSYNGNAIKVIMGEVIVKGGMFDGDFYNLQGSILIYGCVEVRDGRIEGVLSDGSVIDVAYVGEEEQLEIVYDESVCPAAAPTIDDPTSGIESVRSFTLVLVSITTVSLAMAVCCL
mmetsp:Transcript_33965/g.69226  ORF Transcript_33965/g.69226 Transcript_33965/m.69226 type:complete len:280 (+) Transcript_33965:74-913(+)